jgi:hypothetical protein
LQFAICNLQFAISIFRPISNNFDRQSTLCCNLQFPYFDQYRPDYTTLPCARCCPDKSLLSNFTMHSAALLGSLARQPCPAALHGSLAQQPCPRSFARQFDQFRPDLMRALAPQSPNRTVLPPNCMRALLS